MCMDGDANQVPQAAQLHHFHDKAGPAIWAWRPRAHTHDGGDAPAQKFVKENLVPR